MPKRTDLHSILIIGAGPIVIGQACEFPPTPNLGEGWGGGSRVSLFDFLRTIYFLPSIFSTNRWKR